MKKYILVLLLLLTTPTFAANVTGYAWSESVGWFDFSNVTVSDTAVTGYAYNDNTGWLVMDGVTNTSGTLSGYAWSESVGYFNFSNASISSGAITGYAYNDNTGWLSFSTGTTVTTTWAPAVATPAPTTTHTAGGAYYGGGSSSGGGSFSIPSSLQTPTAPTTTPQVNTPNVLPNITAPSPVMVTALGNNPRDLKQNTTGDDVKLLQQFLNSQGFKVSLTGAGAPGSETNFFGSLTRQALAKFQAANNIRPSVGYFGPLTRAFIKSLLVKN